MLSMMLMVSSLALQAGVVEPRGFDDPEQEARYKRLIAELRCLVCQNQNLADSNADLAKDLRNQTYTMIEAGKSDEEIVTFMVNRYGDFVLYRPPIKTTTFLLWFGPLILVVVAGMVLILQVRRRSLNRPAAQLSEQERQKLRTLLADTDRDARP
ncbi:MAG: cytochrome c-type biogenesis protein CcmH [Gammaproteobacteria bacterium]|nr:cytochrome c-type biogenesis protein CcmH [Gammaproteobacteria bacterium]